VTARIAVVGTGGWGKNHVRVLNDLGALFAVCDIDKEKAELFANKYHVKSFDNLETMAQTEKLDGVTICTPASTHFEMASIALKARLHTFVEKPMTTLVKDAEELLKIADKAGRILTVGFIERFNPAIMDLRRIMRENKLGDLLLLEFHRENRRAFSILDVGVVKDASVHDIDTARWLFDEEPTVVYARVGRVMSDHEDFAAIVLGFKKDRTALITTNWVTPKRVRSLSAVFTKGVVTVDFVTQEMQVHEGEGTNIPARFPAPQEPLLLEMKEYLAAIQENRKPLVTGQDGLHVTKIAEAALASSSSGAPIYFGG
jgi:UDP-N-acetylglucosamine 3-dehydrogenase